MPGRKDDKRGITDNFAFLYSRDPTGKFDVPPYALGSAITADLNLSMSLPSPATTSLMLRKELQNSVYAAKSRSSPLPYMYTAQVKYVIPSPKREAEEFGGHAVWDDRLMLFVIEKEPARGLIIYKYKVAIEQRPQVLQKKKDRRIEGVVLPEIKGPRISLDLQHNRPFRNGMEKGRHGRGEFLNYEVISFPFSETKRAALYA